MVECIARGNQGCMCPKYATLVVHDLSVWLHTVLGALNKPRMLVLLLTITLARLDDIPAVQSRSYSTQITSHPCPCLHIMLMIY